MNKDNKWNERVVPAGRPMADTSGRDHRGGDEFSLRRTYLAWLGEQPEADYTVLMGATTYRLMSGFAAASEPGTDGLAALSKVVFSTTLSEPLSWGNTQLVTQDPVEAVREMKDKAATSMRTIGSLTLARSLLQAGLADRFRVVVFPVITGGTGRERIYDG
jgi:dihydrofolate reductase